MNQTVQPDRQIAIEMSTQHSPFLQSLTDLSEIKLESRQLFGGAVEAPIPADYVYASTLRQIPDTQEVFVSYNSSLKEDDSVIIEILERLESNAELEGTDPDVSAAVDHFNELASLNKATLRGELSVIPVDISRNLPEAKAYIVFAAQSALKWPGSAPNVSNSAIQVNLISALGIIRITTPTKADILISLNSGTSDQNVQPSAEILQCFQKLCSIIVQGLHILDWKLFVD
ncbi:uncharacterized protein V1516DRAFT_644064 [Lipomyces oligophaga]|uniref:uncharacterized protein n=1 Tax=Lipomyces oligophaga TaxID=45792 RepID=UPI0034CF796D